MQIDVQALRQHYASLSDEEILAFDREDLIEAAQQCYDQELVRRGLDQPEESDGGGERAYAAGKRPNARGAFRENDEDWIEDAACACSFASGPEGAGAADAENALQVLQDAGIPCQISVEAVETEHRDADQPARQEYRVMVPGALNMIATSVLDREVFNEELDASWRAHFEALTDEQLRALDPELICAGLEDRVMRLQRAYADEVERRQLKRG